MDNRIYIIIDTITQERFDALKLDGIQQSSLDTCRLSTDGTKMLLKWDPTSRPLIEEDKHFEGSIVELHQYMEDNHTDWYGIVWGI